MSKIWVKLIELSPPEWVEIEIEDGVANDNTEKESNGCFNDA